MHQNLGALDRVVRSVIGTLLAATCLLRDDRIELLDWSLAGLGVSIVLTALLGVCPLYWLFGLRTCRP